MPDAHLHLTRRRLLQGALALSLAAAGKAFALLDVTGRVLAEVQVNGQGPFQFLVDTAASRSALSPQLVGKLGLESSSEQARVALLEAGALRLKDVQLPIVPDSQG